LFFRHDARIFDAMRTATPKVKIPLRSSKVAATYPGVRLQPTGGPPQFAIDPIRRAVEAAIEKNADALAKTA
jgi:hypothetical protein